MVYRIEVDDAENATAGWRWDTDRAIGTVLRSIDVGRRRVSYPQQPRFHTAFRLRADFNGSAVKEHHRLAILFMTCDDPANLHFHGFFLAV
jgi:hypothetical protein